MKRLRPNDQRSKIAIVFIWIAMAFDVIIVISDWFQYRLLNDIKIGKIITPEVANSNDSRQMIVYILALVVMIISIVTYIMWFRRAYYNLHLKSKYLSYGEGWAAGSWFVPILAWFRPVQIMNEMYRETNNLLYKAELSKNKEVNLSMVSIWWTFWVIVNISSNISTRYSMGHNELNDLLLTTQWDMINSFISIPMAIFSVKVIKDYAKMEVLMKSLPDDNDTNRPIVLSDDEILDGGF